MKPRNIRIAHVEIFGRFLNQSWKHDQNLQNFVEAYAEVLEEKDVATVVPIHWIDTETSAHEISKQGLVWTIGELLDLSSELSQEMFRIRHM